MEYTKMTCHARKTVSVAIVTTHDVVDHVDAKLLTVLGAVSSLV